MQRIYYINGVGDVAKFRQFYATRIKKANAYHPDARWIIGDTKFDSIVGDYLREIGIDPMRVCIYTTRPDTPNPHQYPVRVIATESKHKGRRVLIEDSTHDIDFKPGNINSLERAKTRKNNIVPMPVYPVRRAL